MNDNHSRPTPPPGPDAHGQAAMLLVESLIHGLISQSVISVAKAVEIVEVASDVSQEIAHSEGSSPKRATTLLQAISRSLSMDHPAGDAGRKSQSSPASRMLGAMDTIDSSKIDAELRELRRIADAIGEGAKIKDGDLDVTAVAAATLMSNLTYLETVLSAMKARVTNATRT